MPKEVSGPIYLERTYDLYLLATICDYVNNFDNNKCKIKLKVEDVEGKWGDYKDLPLTVLLGGNCKECIKYIEMMWEHFCKPSDGSISVDPNRIRKDKIEEIHYPHITLWLEEARLRI